MRHNVDHRHPAVRLFEIGDVFALPSEPTTGSRKDQELPEEWELVGLLLADLDDDAGAAVNAWRVIADSLRLEGAELRPAVRAALHAARTSEIVACDVVLGVVGEVDPETLQRYDLLHTRAGWLELDLLEIGRSTPATAPCPSGEPLPIQ